MTNIQPHRRALLWRALEMGAQGLVLALLAWGWLRSDGTAPRPDSLLLRPIPDAAEQSWVALALASGRRRRA